MASHFNRSDEQTAGGVPQSVSEEVAAVPQLVPEVGSEAVPATVPPAVSETDFAAVGEALPNNPISTENMPAGEDSAFFSTSDDPVSQPAEAPDASDASGDALPAAKATGLYDSLVGSGESSVDKSGVPTVSFRAVSLIYKAQPDHPALDGVSFDIYPGEFVFVVGHSGSGKSTLLKLITRELKATAGDVMVAGKNLSKMRNGKVPYLRRQIGTVYQDFKLLSDKTVAENVAFALECIGKPKAVIRAQVPEVLRLVGLAERMDHFPDQLSGGEQQRVSIARAMVNRPPLLVCDEPTGNLDPAISLGIMRLLDRINQAGTTVVMATHDREMVDSMRRRVIALESGHIMRDVERGGYGYYGAL